MRTFRPSFPTQMTQETGQRPNGAAAAILAVSAPRIDARAHLAGVYLRRFCRRRIFVRQCSRVILADSSLNTELSTPGRFRLRVVSTAFFGRLSAHNLRKTRGVRGRKRGGGSRTRLKMQCAQWNASRAAAWRRRRVAVARAVRIDFVRNFVFSRVSKKNQKSAKCRNTVP